MSECLQQIIEPFREDWSDNNELNTLIPLAIIAWNTALLPEPEQQEMLERFIGEQLAQKGAASDENRADATFIRSVLQELCKRKNEMFPDDVRRPLNFKIRTQGSGGRLEVQSAIPVKDEAI
ncbi:hypothetical protein [Armatimonas sp.]|uniref:hypothetical protein n=1 Tax=Armatimonas sp. TaxID=1872638 RepID=UPI00286B7208|nr:hypothetical protein [Armatimonas sp.]